MHESGDKHGHSALTHGRQADDTFESLCLSCLFAAVSADPRTLVDADVHHSCHGREGTERVPETQFAELSQFSRKLVYAENQIFSSECRFCGTVVGYSSHAAVLDITESVHRCHGLQQVREMGG